MKNHPASRERDFFSLFANCKLVKGATNSIIMDLQRSCFYSVHPLIGKLLSVDFKKKSIIGIKNVYQNRYDKGISAIFEYLSNEGLGFFTNEPDNFPDISTTFRTPYKILTAVINFSQKSKYDLENVLVQFVKMGCQLVQIRIFNNIDLKKINNMLKSIAHSRIRLIELFLKDYGYDQEDLCSLLNNSFRLNIIIHSINSDIIDIRKDGLILTKETIGTHQKEIISIGTMVCNLPFFNESMNFNVGLNRKVSIDYDGNIKNFVNHLKSFGNVNKIKIENAIKQKVFQELWNIRNDNIEKCKDCEYRYMCLSNSDIIKKDSRFYKVDDCNYDPYSGKWKNN